MSCHSTVPSHLRKRNSGLHNKFAHVTIGAIVQNKAGGGEHDLKSSGSLRITLQFGLHVTRERARDSAIL